MFMFFIVLSKFMYRSNKFSKDKMKTILDFDNIRTKIIQTEVSGQFIRLAARPDPSAP